jgi:hypothetical protein
MIGPLHRKLLRDLRELSGPITTIAVVVACGVSAFLSLSGTHRALVDARARYYTAQRMGDVFATAERAPESLAARIAALPGVSRVQTRVVTGVRIPMPSLESPADGLLVSIPRDGVERLSAIRMVSGRRPLSGHDDEVVVLRRSPSFTGSSWVIRCAWSSRARSARCGWWAGHVARVGLPRAAGQLRARQRALRGGLDVAAGAGSADGPRGRLQRGGAGAPGARAGAGGHRRARPDARALRGLWVPTASTGRSRTTSCRRTSSSSRASPPSRPCSSWRWPPSCSTWCSRASCRCSAAWWPR